MVGSPVRAAVINNRSGKADGSRFFSSLLCAIRGGLFRSVGESLFSASFKSLALMTFIYTSAALAIISSDDGGRCM